jgi:hypothetical protein
LEILVPSSNNKRNLVQQCKSALATNTDTGFITFFKFKNLRTPVFKPGPVLCTQYTFPNAKDDESTKFYDKLKIGAYVNI